MKLRKICKYEGTITLVTGLAIRGASNEMGIGGADSEVIKNPITGEPYLPGSSLKGKMRSQLERALEKVDESGLPCGCGEYDCPICTIFGTHRSGYRGKQESKESKETREDRGKKTEKSPTRIIVRDSVFTSESREKIRSLPLERGGYLELKAENMIHRSSGTAESPRFMERIPAGLTFTLEILLQIFDDDDENKMKKHVENALRLVENSYLGGSGSRGYGQVKFNGEWKDVEVIK